MRPHTRRTLVLCEGNDDKLVMQGLARHAGLGDRLEFRDYGGETNLRRNLATLKVSPEFARGEFAKVLVTRDADQDFSGAWASITASIQAVFSQAPAGPGEWVVATEGAQIAAWVVPGPGKTGMIETLCLDAARSKSPAMFECLDPFVDCLGRLHEGTPHEKVRFALWTIIAQGQGARKRLSLERAMDHIPFHWDDAAFAGLKDLLCEIATSSTSPPA